MSIDFRIAIPSASNDMNRYWVDTSHKHVIAPWKPCQLINEHCFINENDVEERSAIVRIGEQKFELPKSKLAFSKASHHLHHGARVVAKRRSIDLPYTIDAQTCKQIPIYDSQDQKLYPGILAVKNDSVRKQNRLSHVVFFDDGHVQSVDKKDIRLVLESDSLQHGECLDFFDRDFNSKQCCFYSKSRNRITVPRSIPRS